jgi:hypothetical protein
MSVTLPATPKITALLTRARPAADAILAEMLRAGMLNKPFNSTHEGYGVLLEEVDELWDDVKSNQKINSLDEAIQVGAMALRYMTDLFTEAEILAALAKVEGKFDAAKKKLAEHEAKAA